MGFLPVPWAVEGGAKNVTEEARILAYVAARGNFGVLSASDLKVTQTNTASTNVQIARGVCIIPCRTPMYDYQAYIGSRPTADPVSDLLPIPANIPLAPRYDMVVARVENPHLTGETWPQPADVSLGPYVFVRLLTNVGAAAIANHQAAQAYLAAQGMSAIPLAGVSMPGGGVNVIDSYLRNLRKIANPRRESRLFIYMPTARQNVPSDWGTWFAPSAWKVDVPTWATQVSFSCAIYGAKVDRQSSSVDGHTNGAMRLDFGGGAGQVDSLSFQTNYDLDAPNNSGATRTTVGLADTLDVEPGWRGTTQPFLVQADQQGGNQPFYIDGSSSVTISLEFSEATL